MKLPTILFFIPLLLSVACTSTRKPGAAAGGDAVPEAARPDDIAKLDDLFKTTKRSGFYPEPAETPPLTPQESAYVVELDQQRVYFYHGSKLLAGSKIASGRSGYRTETGRYVSGQKDLNHRSTLYGSFVSSKGGTIMGDVTAGFDPTPVGARFQGAMMKYFQRFERPNGQPTAMGFHQGVVPGYPASHGCVRLPAQMAKWFYDNVPKGTPIVVRGTKYGVPYGTRQARAKRSPKVHSSLKQPAAPPTDPQTPPPGAEDAPASAPSTPSGPSDPAAPTGPVTAPEPAAPAPAAPDPVEPNPTPVPPDR